MLSDHEPTNSGHCACCGVVWPCPTLRKATRTVLTVKANGTQLVRDVIPV